MNAAEAHRRGLDGAHAVRVTMGSGEVSLGLLIDEHVPAGCISIPFGYAETVPLGGQGPAGVTGSDL